MHAHTCAHMHALVHAHTCTNSHTCTRSQTCYYSPLINNKTLSFYHTFHDHRQAVAPRCGRCTRAELVLNESPVWQARQRPVLQRELLPCLCSHGPCLRPAMPSFLLQPRWGACDSEPFSAGRAGVFVMRRGWSLPCGRVLLSQCHVLGGGCHPRSACRGRSTRVSKPGLLPCEVTMTTSLGNREETLVGRLDPEVTVGLALCPARKAIAPPGKILSIADEIRCSGWLRFY